MAADREEDFRPTSGRLLGVLGIVVAAGAVVLGVADPDVDPPAWVYALAVFVAVMIWVSLLRPRIWVGGGDLVLRTSFETARIPLAAVESMVVRQVLVVAAGGRRYTCAALGRSRRVLLRGSSGPGGGGLRSFFGMGGDSGSTFGHDPVATQRALGVDYTDFVESRLEELTRRARQEARVRPGSPEQAELAADVRRERAWPEVVAVVVSALGLVLAILLG